MRRSIHEPNNRIYQELYERTENVLKKYNPCKREGSKCLGGNPTPCCLSNYTLKDCGYLTDKGCICTPLKCKTWLCNTALRQIDKEGIDELKMIETIGKQHGFLEDPYIGGSYVGMDEF